MVSVSNLISPLHSSLDLNDRTDLCDLGLLDLLEHDPRPAFLLNAAYKKHPELEKELVYYNTGLVSLEPGIVKTIIHDNEGSGAIGKDAAQFRRWVYHHDTGSTTPFCFSGYDWKQFLIAQRWLVVIGSPMKTACIDHEAKDSGGQISKSSLRSTFNTFDWTDDHPPVTMSSHVAWARCIDWANTPLGPMRAWSPQLRSNASLIMQDPRPAVGFYGPELIMIYNESYVELLGELHPCMGRSAREVFAPIWNDYFEPIIERNIAGETVDNSNTEIPLFRNGYLEETYFSTWFIPIFDAEGATIGHYEPVAETTKEVILERRSRTLLQLSQELPRARDSDAVWDHVVQVLSRNEKDVPFALLYSAGSDDEWLHSFGDASEAPDDQRDFILRRYVGLRDKPSLTLEQLDARLKDGVREFLEEAVEAGQPITLDLTQDPDISLLRDLPQLQASSEKIKLAAVCPLRPSTTKEITLGFIVLGLNPRRPYDQTYSKFIGEAAHLISASLAALILHEEEIGRQERTSELVKAELKYQLAESQKEADRSLSKFQRFAERSNIGIFILDMRMKGIFSYRNDAWFSICGTDDRGLTIDCFWDLLVDDEYIPSGKSNFEALANTREPQSFELRLKSTWSMCNGDTDVSPSEQQQKWVLCSIFPELSDTGDILEITGCITEISRQKWGEQLQAAQATQAKESKQQLENFIDATSHEMRNPLSVILQCADSIISSHKSLVPSACRDEKYQQMLLATLDSANTIVQCSKHMRTIADDVLTISKLDFGLFAMTPIDVSVESTARDAVRMFDEEAKSAQIDLKLKIDDSCRKLDGATVSLDPTRVLQILINLLTNAIKFTRLEAKRRILVSLSILFEEPTHSSNRQVVYIPRARGSEAKSLLADWERGRNVFLRFSVEDTGTGMTEEQHHLLFTRFSQASPRTHIDYGGSGLGLFISRRLSEMHGGAIGFTSKKGVGSTICFYVRSRQSESTSFKRPKIEDRAIVVDRGVQPYRSSSPSKSKDEKAPKASGADSLEKSIPDDELYILIVEDNLVNQRILAKQLRSLGMHVAVANHGGEALDYLRTTRYCVDSDSATELTLILLDWEMPVMNGLECVACIRTMQEKGILNSHVPVIGVTANVRSEQVETALHAGMDNVISKPFRIPELRDCIQTTLHNSALARPLIR